MAEHITCPTCKRSIPLTDDRKVAMHMSKPGKPAAGACPSSLLAVALVTGGRIR